MLTTLCRVVESVHADLNEIAKSVQELSFPAVRRFIVEYMMMDVGELYLYSAFKTPSDELFYLPQDSPEWKDLNSRTRQVQIENKPKFWWQFRFFINTICSTGSAMFKAFEKPNLISQGFSIATQATFYRLQSEQAVMQFRFWLVTNKQDYKKMLMFFNQQNSNKAVKSGQNLLLAKVAVNRKLFVPMLAKVFDLDESAEYDGLTEEKLLSLEKRGPEKID